MSLDDLAIMTPSEAAAVSLRNSASFAPFPRSVLEGARSRRHSRLPRIVFARSFSVSLNMTLFAFLEKERLSQRSGPAVVIYVGHYNETVGTEYLRRPGVNSYGTYALRKLYVYAAVRLQSEIKAAASAPMIHRGRRPHVCGGIFKPLDFLLQLIHRV